MRLSTAFIAAARYRDGGPESMGMMLRHVWMVAAALLALVCFPARAQQYSFQSYDRKSGLESQTINCMLQDHRGFIWACSEMGLYRFDGTNFVRMGRAEGFDKGEYVTAIDENVHTGRFWVATQSGLRVGDGLHFQKVEPDGKPLVVDVARQLVALDDGRLLLIRDNRLMVLSPRRSDGQWQLAPMFSAAQLDAYPQLRTVTTAFSYQNSLWIGCDTALCEVSADGRIHVHGADEGVPPDTWSGLRVDNQGTLWLRGVHQVRARPAGSARFVARDVPGKDMDTVTDNGTFVEDPSGHILTPTNHGLARWNGAAWDVIDARNGLPDIGITAVLFDRDGTMWLGTYGRGIYRLSNYGLVDGWGRGQGLDSVPNWSILRDGQGMMWFGNELGGSVLPRGQAHMSPWPVSISPAPRQVLAMVKAADGAIWIGLYEHRLLRYDPVSKRTELAARLPALIKALLFDRRGRLWIGTVNGIYYIDHLGAPLQRVPVEQSTDNQCSDIAEDGHGALWFACNAGVLRYADDRWTLMAATEVSMASGFAAITIGADNSLWLGANEPGVFRGKVVGDQLTIAAVDDSWLQRSLVYFIRRDRRGWIWVGGGGGVDVYNGKSWTHLSQDDGLIWDETDQNTFFEDGDGSIWIGTPVGISHILKPEAMLSASPHSVVITSVTHGAQPVDEGDTVPNDGNHAPLIVRYSLLGPISSTAPHFRYRLQGSDWIETSSHVISFTGLSSGHYRFEVQSIDEDRRSMSPSATFTFRISAPWWFAWWTYPLEIVFVAVLLALIWRWRSRLLLRQNRRLEDMVAKRTAELTEEKRELEMARAELYVQATHDGLTGLYNRMAILELLAAQLAPGARASPGLAVALIDADHFKRINDTFGHQAGDATLQAIAQHLQSYVRGGDQLGRYGGEEILMVLPGIGHVDAENRMLQIQQAVSGIAHSWQGDPFRVTLSVGLVWVGRETVTVEDVIRRADFALYEAKSGGRDRVVSETLLGAV
jgi:diguanylate cyclase (GGDEF)-like protein